MTDPLVILSGVVKRFGDFTAVHRLDLEITAGEFVAIMGPSGCGKTTTLRMIAGLEVPTEGEVRISGRLMNAVPVHERDTPMVWQLLALFPFLNARENVEFGLRMRGVGAAERRRRAVQWLERLEIGEFAERNVATLSGGQRQRVALARALVPERHNAVKVLIFFDVGGSMSPHVKVCEELFSACKTEFKHLQYYYFHNCLYDFVWEDNRRRNSEPMKTWDVLHTYGSDYKVIFVGDASMSPYEIAMPGGSVEYWNEEAGEVWLNRIAQTFTHCVWLNPVPKRHWQYTPSIGMIGDIFERRMFELTLQGLDDAIKELSH